MAASHVSLAALVQGISGPCVGVRIAELSTEFGEGSPHGCERLVVHIHEFINFRSGAGISGDGQDQDKSVPSLSGRALRSLRITVHIEYVVLNDSVLNINLLTFPPQCDAFSTVQIDEHDPAKLCTPAEASPITRW